MIAAGSVVDVQGTASTGLSTADGVLQQVAQILNAGGQLTVTGSPTVLNSSLAGMALGTFLSLNPDQPFQFDIQVICNSAFSAPGDVSSIVANAIYQANGEYPTSVSAVSVTAPNSQGTTPGVTSSSVGGAASTAGASVQTSISSFFSGLGTLGTNLLIGLAAVVVLVLVLVAYGPNVGKVASAVA